MSSFICSAKHFNSIENKLNKLFCYDQDEFKYFYPAKGVYSALYDTSKNLYETIEAQVKEVVNHWRDLNAICVTLQYADRDNDNINEEIKTQKAYVRTKTSTKELTLNGLYNALRCLDYQIEIHHLTELGGMTEEQKKAFDFLHKLIDGIAHIIVRKLPDDKSNTWEVN